MSSICDPLMTYIDGPPPIAPVYGLLPAAEAPAAGVRIVPDADSGGVERWLNGAEVYPYPAHKGAVQDGFSVGTNRVKDDGDITVVDFPQFSAFTAYLPVTCKSWKVWDQEEFKARAVETFAAVESSIVAREFMFGNAIPSNPHLTDGTGIFPAGDTILGVTQGVAALEREIALTGRLGIIHVSPQMLSSFSEPWAIDTKTGVIRTLNGIPVVPDFGYAAASTPTGHAAAAGTTEWMYATGPVDIRRSDVFVMPERVEQALDRGTSGSASVGKGNSITYRVERYYLVDWDTVLHAAVLVDKCKARC